MLEEKRDSAGDIVPVGTEDLLAPVPLALLLQGTPYTWFPPFPGLLYEFIRRGTLRCEVEPMLPVALLTVPLQWFPLPL